MQPKLQFSETLFLANWERALFIHFRLEPQKLQPLIPFALDLHEDHAYVSLVAFTMSHFRPRIGGKVWGWLTRPFGNHSFLNIRTYVKHQGEPGIYFIKEYVTRRMNIPLGRMLYGLPYHLGKLDYQHRHERGFIKGTASDPVKESHFAYSAEFESAMKMKYAEPNTLDEFLIERYTAYTCWRGKPRLFRINHQPWPQTRVDLKITDDALLHQENWFHDAEFVFANYSPGLTNVEMGRPVTVTQFS